MSLLLSASVDPASENRYGQMNMFRPTTRMSNSCINRSFAPFSHLAMSLIAGFQKKQTQRLLEQDHTSISL
jgi:hypothetical protein